MANADSARLKKVLVEESFGQHPIFRFRKLFINHLFMFIYYPILDDRGFENVLFSQLVKLGFNLSSSPCSPCFKFKSEFKVKFESQFQSLNVHFKV
jgi:hypothetical protein